MSYRSSAPIATPGLPFRTWPCAAGRCRFGSTAATRPCPRTRISANRDNREIVQDALKKSSIVVDSVVDWIPSFVPRTVAKVLVTVIGLSIVGSLFQQVLSTVVFLAVVGAIGYILFSASSSDDDATTRSDDDDEDDPIARANKIMDKYR